MMISTKKILLGGAILLTGFICIAPTTCAADNQTVPAGDQTTPAANQTVPAGNQTTAALTNPLQVASLTDLIAKVTQTVVVLGGMFLTFMLIYTGFLFVMARGNEEKVSSARTALLWTVVGGILLLGANAIAIAISSTATSL
jgi:hypothetical protein